MPSQQDIDRFTLAFHRQAMERLRADPSGVAGALATLRRWRVQRGPLSSDTYLDRWEDLLNAGVAQLAEAVCSETSEAATLRSMSPLGFLLNAQERQALRRQTMTAPLAEAL